MIAATSSLGLWDTGFWTAFGTCGLFAVAIFALVVAIRQLNTVKTERTVSLIKEISSEEMETVLGFFDFAANKEVSRQAFSNLFAQLIKHRPEAIRQKIVVDLTGATKEAASLILQEINASMTLPPNVLDDERREKELRRRLILATNFFERLWALVHGKTVDATLFLESRSYDIVAVYYIVEEILSDLVRHEEFNFEDFRFLAVLAQNHLAWLPPTDPLRTASFQKLPLSGQSLRDRA